MAIKNIIFDLGGVLIPIKFTRTRMNFMKMGLFFITKKLKEIFMLYEMGKISTKEFVFEIHKHTPFGSKERITKSWLQLLGDFREENFAILKWLKISGYKMFLLSNLNELHLEEVKRKMGEENYKNFGLFFKKMYFSHEIGLRKPQKEAYNIILQENNIYSQETLFIDDSQENILGAKSVKLNTWHFNPKKLYFGTKKKNLFFLGSSTKHKYMKEESIYQRKAASRLQESLGEVFLKEFDYFKEGSLISVTYVKISPDLSVARINLSIFPEGESHNLLKEINTRKKEIRKILGNKLKGKFKRFPDLHFYKEDLIYLT